MLHKGINFFDMNYYRQDWLPGISRWPDRSGGTARPRRAAP